VPAFQSEWAAALNNLAVFRLGQKRLNEAQGFLEEAIRHQKAAWDADPKSATYPQRLADHHRYRIGIFLQQQAHADAARAAAEMVETLPEDATVSYRAAQCFGYCILLAQNDSQLSVEARRAMIQEYTQQAIRRVRESVTRGLRDGKSLEKDEAFQAIRSSEEFSKLVAEVQARQK
jgi:hypothetical protein